MWGGMIRLMWLVETSYWTCLTWWFLNGFNVIVWNLLLDICLTWCFFGGVNCYIPRLLVDWWSWSLRIHWCVCIFVKFITTSTSSHLPVSHYFSTSRLTGRKTPTYLLTFPLAVWKGEWSTQFNVEAKKTQKEKKMFCLLFFFFVSIRKEWMEFAFSLSWQATT